MASSVSILVLFSLILPNILETNCNIQYKSNGLCDFGCEIKLVSHKSRFARNQIFDGNFKAVHLDLQRMNNSSPDFFSLQEVWNILRPFWVKEEYSDELLRALSSVQFEKYSFKSSKTVFRTNVLLLGMLKNECDLLERECMIRAVSYTLLRNVTTGNGLVCYDVLVMERLQHICCHLTTSGNSVQCKKQPSFSLQWRDVFSVAERYLVIIVMCLLPGVLVIPFLPYTEDNFSASDDDTSHKMVEPDQDVNPITKYMKRHFVGKLVATSSPKAYRHAAIILILATLLFIGTLYALTFCELFNFEEKIRKHFILEALPLLPTQTKTILNTSNDWLVGNIALALEYVRTPFRNFYLAWFCFHVLLLPPLLYIAGVSSSQYLIPLLYFSKGVKKSTVNVRSELSVLFREFVNVFRDIVRKTKVLNTEAGLLYLLEAFLRGLVCIVLFAILLTLFVCLCFGIIAGNTPYLLLIISVLSAILTTPRLAGGLVARRKVKCIAFVQIAGWFLQFLSYTALCFGMQYLLFPTSLVLVLMLTYSLVGLNVNHSVLLPYMTFYGIVAYFLFRFYSSYVCGYVEFRELAFDACTKIVEEKGDEQDIRRVVSRDDKGIIRISEKLLEHIYSEMKPLKKTVREMLFKMVVCCGLFYLFYHFIIEVKGTEIETRIPPLMQVALTLSVGVFPKLYDACKTGSADKNNLTQMRKKARVENIVKTFAEESATGP